jgi:hypothetical protein
MADGVTVDNGGLTDYEVATDDCGADGHTPIVKLAIATDGSVTLVPADATNGLDVDVTRVVPGTSATHLGKAEDAAHTDGDTGVLMLGVRNYSGAGTDGDYSAFSTTATGEQRVMAHRDLVRIADSSAASELTIASTAYTAGDQVGVMFQFANAARVSGGTGTLIGLVLTSAADIIGGYDVVLCRSNISLAADNAAFAISDTDALEVIAVVQLVGAIDIGNNRIAQQFSIAVPYDCSGGTTLYGALITRSGHTFFGAHTDLQLTAWVERN